MRIAIIFLLIAISGCSSEYKIDSYASWCDSVTKDIRADVVTIDRGAIRNDFAKVLSDSFIQGYNLVERADEMAWVEGKTLHIENLSSLLVVDPNIIINRFRDGIAAHNPDREIKDPEDFLFGAIFNFFDSVTIHSIGYDNTGLKRIDTPTVIETKRRGIYSKSTAPAIRAMAERSDF